MQSAVIVVALVALSAEPGERTQARDAFDAGSAAYETGDFRAALASFENAMRIAPHDFVLYNIAKCLDALGQYAEAAAAYRQVAGSPNVERDVRTRAVAALGLAESRVARIVVQGRDGAPIAIDGKFECTSPCVVRVNPGRHTVVAGTAGDATEYPVDAAAGARVTIRLVALVVQDERNPPEPSTAPGWLTYVGGTAVLVGAVGTIGFGLHTRSLHDEHALEPTEDLRSRGLRARALTNVSIAVAIAGAMAVLVDLLFLGERRAETMPAQELDQVRAVHRGLPRRAPHVSVRPFQ
jgi:hypothetical protein